MGTLDPSILISAYAQGFFPMADPDTGEINWYRPARRGIMPLEPRPIARSLKTRIKRATFEIRADTDFERVMRECAAARPDRPETWINAEMITAYTTLHELGWAHCVEAYRDGRLVGGLYGVSINAAFFGESMFSRPEWGGTDASKICLLALLQHLRRQRYRLLDTQMITPHLARLGCIEIPDEAYRPLLRRAINQADTTWGRFEPDGLLRSISDNPDSTASPAGDVVRPRHKHERG